MVDLSPDGLELRAVVSSQGFVASFFERLDLRFDCSFVEADDLVVLMHVDAEHVAKRRNEVILVHNAVAFERFVIDALRDLSKLGRGFGLQFVVGVGHCWFSGCNVDLFKNFAHSTTEPRKQSRSDLLSQTELCCKPETSSA